MAEVEVSNHKLIVTLKGWHKLWALKSRLEYSLSHVEKAEIDPEAAQKPVGLRSAGSFIPGLLTAGSYRGRNGWDFWDVRQPERVIVIYLIDENYQRLILEVDNPTATVKMIENALAERSTGAPGP